MSAGLDVDGKIAVLSVTEGEGFGAEVVLHELLKSWETGPQHLRIIAPPETGIYRKAGELGYPVVAFPASRDSLKCNTQAAWKVKSHIGDCQVIHGWTARTYELLPLLRSRRSQKLSATLHDHPAADFHGKLRRFLMKFFANKMDGLVTVSKAVASACSDMGYAVPVTTIHNGLNEPDWLTQSRAGTPVSDSDHLNLVFLGMYSPGKGFDLIESLIRNESLPPHLKWHLYGNVWEGYQDRVSQLKDFTDRVVIHGRQPAKDIFTVADILIHASTSFDSLPTVLIESARSGIPAIASSLGGAGEIIIDGKTGFLFNPEHPESLMELLLSLSGNPHLLNKMGQSAINHFESHFKVAQMKDKYIGFWSRLIGNG